MYTYLCVLIEFKLKKTNFTQTFQRYSVPIEITENTLKVTNLLKSIRLT